MDAATSALLFTAVASLATAVTAIVKSRGDQRIRGRTVAAEEVDSALKVLGSTIDRQALTITRQDEEIAALRRRLANGGTS